MDALETAVREHLKAVLSSPQFASAARARRFLTYIVEQTLDGHSDGIKEVVLGVEVFDRPADFEPKADTIVRVEAGRLRKRLLDYYAAEGAGSPVRIDVPVGSYVPRFQTVAAPPESVVAPVRTFAVRRYAIAAACAALLAGAGWWLMAGRHALQPAPAIAVLPFLDLSSDRGSEYFADGLTEELTDAICNAGSLQVAARTSAFFFKGKPADVQDIGRRLHVAYLIEGSVRRQGDQLKVTAQLIRTGDGYHLWSGSFDQKLDDVFAVQHQIAGSVVDVLRTKIAGWQPRVPRRQHAANPKAFELYLQAKQMLNSFGRFDLAKTEAVLQAAIAADPEYAPSYIALTEFYGRSMFTSDRSPEETYRLGEAAIQRALRLDPDSADAHALSGLIAARHGYDWKAAERELRYAIRLNPSSALAHYTLAQSVLAPQERWTEAVSENRVASELDPLSPLTAYSGPWLDVLRRDHAAAIAGFQTLATRYPNDQMVAGGLAAAFLARGDFGAALGVLDRQGHHPQQLNILAVTGHVQGRNGNRAAAERILAELEARHAPANALAMVHLGLGDADAAFRQLDKAREQRSDMLILARVASFYDPVRGDPRFQALLKSIGLADDQLSRNQ